MFTATVSGSVELRYVAGKLRKAGVAELRKELAKAQRRTFRPLEREIKVEAAATLPHRGGYSAVMSRTVRVSVRQNIARVEVVAVVSARGRKALRDVARVNRSQLRHPVFGRIRMTKRGPMRNPWAVTTVTPGFVDRPVRRLEDRLARESLDALEAVAKEIAR